MEPALAAMWVCDRQRWSEQYRNHHFQDMVVVPQIATEILILDRAFKCTLFEKRVLQIISFQRGACRGQVEANLQGLHPNPTEFECDLVSNGTPQ